MDSTEWAAQSRRSAGADQADRFGLLEEFQQRCDKAESLGWDGDVGLWLEEAAGIVEREDFVELVEWMATEVDYMVEDDQTQRGQTMNTDDQSHALPHYHDEGRDACPACADNEIRRGEGDYRRWKDNLSEGEDYAVTEELAHEARDPSDGWL